MTQLRLAAVVAVAGLGLASGCCGIGQGQLLNRMGFRRDCECSRNGSGPVVGSLGNHVEGTLIGGGPIIDDPGACAAPGTVQPGPMLTPVPGTTTEPPYAQPGAAGPTGPLSRRRDQ